MAKKKSRQQKYVSYVERALKRVEQYEKRGWYVDPAYKAKLEQRLDVKVRGTSGSKSSTEMVTRKMFSSKELYKHSTLSTDKGTITSKQAREQGYSFSGKRLTPLEQRIQKQNMIEELTGYTDTSKYDDETIAGINFEIYVNSKIGTYDYVRYSGHKNVISNFEDYIAKELQNVINKYGYNELGKRVQGNEEQIENAFHDIYYFASSISSINYSASSLLSLIINRPLTSTETMKIAKGAYDDVSIDSEVMG